MKILHIPIIAISFLLTTRVMANNQNTDYSQEGDFFYPTMAPYIVNGDQPEGFRDFFFFRLDYKKGESDLTIEPNGTAYIEGVLLLKDHTVYKFKSAKLI